MTTVVQVVGPSVGAATNAARRALGVPKARSKELYRSWGYEGLHRVTLSNDIVVEITVIPGKPSQVINIHKETPS